MNIKTITVKKVVKTMKAEGDLNEDEDQKDAFDVVSCIRSKVDGMDEEGDRKKTIEDVFNCIQQAITYGDNAKASFFIGPAPLILG